MASNSFGEVFRITTFGESHGSHMGVVIDGCPSGIFITEEEINLSLRLRAPGNSPYTSPRNEKDKAILLSGIFEGQTTGAPIAILIENKDGKQEAYEELKKIYRPSHANFTYLKKYGIYDYRGGGRASGRETALRVAAGAIAKKLLERFDITCLAFVDQIGEIQGKKFPSSFSELKKEVLASPIFCPDQESSLKMQKKILEVKEEGDSIGGVIQGIALVPAGLGDPIYRKIDALLAFAMLSIPASKGFEIGEGFKSASMKGSEHNDPFEVVEGNICPKTNLAGGALGGITTGAPLTFRVAFKPTSSIQKKQDTVTLEGEKRTFQLSSMGRHDPCIAIRAAPVVEAMTALVLADCLLASQILKV